LVFKGFNSTNDKVKKKKKEYKKKTRRERGRLKEKNED